MQQKTSTLSLIPQNPEKLLVEVEGQKILTTSEETGKLLDEADRKIERQESDDLIRLITAREINKPELDARSIRQYKNHLEKTLQELKETREET